MKNGHKFLLLVALVAAALLAGLLLEWGGDTGDSDVGSNAAGQGVGGISGVGLDDAAKVDPAAAVREVSSREVVGQATTTVRGRVVTAEGGRGVAGVEVRALSRHPAFAELEVRITDFVKGGFWKPRAMSAPPEILARATSGADGSFEVTGIGKGRVFLDARSGSWFSRSTVGVRLAEGETTEGVTILLSPGGRVKGKVLGVKDEPVERARVVLRPSASSILAQLTSRSFRWFEVETDAAGEFDFAGVPPGHGWAVSAIAPTMALAQQRDISVAIGQTAEVLLRGRAGAVISGRVTQPDGEAAADALVGFVYLDLSRVLFSVGPANPISTDKDGRYEIHNVGAGHVAVSALHPDLALAPLHNLTVVDGGDYDVDLVLTLGDKLEGIVVDDSGKPVEGATVTARTLAQPRGLDLSMIAKFVRYEAETDAQGKFTLRGLITDRFFLEAEKTGFLNGKRVWRRGRDKEPVRLELSRGLFLAGRVVDQKGDPVTRFRIKAVPARRNELRVGPRWGRPQRNPNPYTDRSPWQRRGSFEIQDPNGEFRVGPLKAGKLQLSADAKGFVPSKRQTIELEDKNEVEPLVVELTKGVILRGRVLAGGAPVGDAQVTWRRHRERRRGFLPFKINVQPEDFDFMAMDSTLGTRSVITDANGAFELTGVSAGKVQLTARQPDYAKSESATLDIAVGEERSDIVLELRKGGAIEGSVTGLTGQPVKTAVIVALSIQAGVMKSSNTDAAGHYRISGLASGSYIVFKTKLDAALESLFADVLGNVRMKSTTVRDGRTSRVDIKDRTAGGVDVFGRVMSGNKPLPRAIVTLLGQDRSGPFGIGLRTATANDKGEYLLASVFPGKYMCQITRHTNARPEVASQSLVVPRGQMRIRADLHFPSCEIAGVVVDATGKPLKGVRVRAVGERRDRPGGLLGLIGDGGASRVRTDDAGQFRVRRLAPGSWTLHAAPRGAQRDHYGAGETSAIRVDTGGTINGVRIVLPLAAVLEGTVRDGNGAPIAGVAVRAFKDGERPSGKVADASMRSAEGFGDLRRALRHVTRSDSSGKWKLRGLLPGSWTVAAEKDGMFASGERRVRVGLGNNVPVDLQMKRGGRVYVRALGVDGKTLAGGTVRVLDSKGQQVGRAKSLFSLMASLFRSRNKDNKSQWMDMGTLPPDTYTLEVTQKLADGKKQVRTTKRTLREGEEARWVVKVEELVQR